MDRVCCKHKVHSRWHTLKDEHRCRIVGSRNIPRSQWSCIKAELAPPREPWSRSCFHPDFAVAPERTAQAADGATRVPLYDGSQGQKTSIATAQPAPALGASKKTDLLQTAKAQTECLPAAVALFGASRSFLASSPAMQTTNSSQSAAGTGHKCRVVASVPEACSETERPPRFDRH